ncbi:MAG: hypothetical protein Q9169_007207 [Polycauliona sp. 2 TL-2023]
MLDVSQQGPEDLGSSNPPLSEPELTDGPRPMDLDASTMPEMLVFQQRYMEAPYRYGDFQNEWTANDHEGSSIQYPGSTLPQPSHGALPALYDTNGAADGSFFSHQTQRMFAQFADFDQNFLPEQQQRAWTTHATAEPRYVPWPTASARPWSAEALGHAQFGQSPGAQELLYEPATDLHLLYPLVEAFTEELHQDTSSGSDTYPVDEASPENNIDPPPPLNPCKFETEMDVLCNGCKKKRMSSLILGCLCVKLPELTQYFIPPSLAEMHDTHKLRAFAVTHVRCWLQNRFDIYVTWGHDFRPIKVAVTEIEPVGTRLLIQNQYRLNLSTNQYDFVQVPSPPLGIQLMCVDEWRARLDGYLEGILRDSFRRIPAVCFRGDDCCVGRDFLIPIFDYHEVASGRKKELVHRALKLVLLTFIMSHSLTIVEDTRDSVYRQLKNRPENPFGYHTSARWLNKQIKFLLSTLHQKVFEEMLSGLQDTLRHSKRIDFWAPLFASMVVLAITTELLEVTVRCKEQTDKQEDIIKPDDKTADRDITQMDERFDLLIRLFHQGYRTLLPKGFNPLQNPTGRNDLDHAGISLASKGREIVEQYHPFLIARQVLGPPITTSDPQTGRLLAQFLLCFLPPVEQNQPQPAISTNNY